MSYSGALSTYKPQPLQTVQLDAAQLARGFVQRVAQSRSLWAVYGKDGIAHTPSQIAPGHRTYLVWSGHHEAARWADVLTANPQLACIELTSFLSEVLPGIAAEHSTVAVDWSAEPIEPEVAPLTLAHDIRDALVSEFTTLALKTRMIWVLHDMDGYATIPGPDGATPVLPVWSDRAGAEQAAVALQRFVSPARVPLAEFMSRYLMSPTGVRTRLAPGYVPGPGATVMSPWQFKALLNGTDSSLLRVA
jgi:Protein of unknown function (DUF2750)